MLHHIIHLFFCDLLYRLDSWHINFFFLSDVHSSVSVLVMNLFSAMGSVLGNFFLNGVRIHALKTLDIERIVTTHLLHDLLYRINFLNNVCHRHHAEW